MWLADYAVESDCCAPSFQKIARGTRTSASSGAWLSLLLSNEAANLFEGSKSFRHVNRTKCEARPTRAVVKVPTTTDNHIIMMERVSE